MTRRLPRMRRGALRRLSAAERGLAAEVFAAGLDPEQVRIWAQPAPWPVRPFVASGRLIVWPYRTALADFGGPEAPLSVQGVFVHELTHVWQAQNGVNLLMAKLRAGDGPGAYAYELGRELGFPDLNIEQQAMVVQHAFLLRRGGRAPYTAEQYAAILPDWGRG